MASGNVPEHRRRAIEDLDRHSLRHFCGWYLYVHLGFSDELTAYQLGHADAKLVRDLYGHGKADALERLKRPGPADSCHIAATCRRGIRMRGGGVHPDLYRSPRLVNHRSR